MADILVQRITHKRSGQDLDLSWLSSFTLVETMDLSGPRFEFTLRDPYRLFRDDLRVVAGDEFEVFLSDRFGEDQLDRVFSLTTTTPVVKGDYVTFQGFESTVWALKQPAKKAQLFARKPIKTILAQLVPGKHQAGRFPEATYHLLPGMRPTKLLRQMATENGAACFYRRGVLHFEALADLFAAEAAMTYFHNAPREPLSVAHYSLPGAASLIRDRIDRQYIGWDMVRGPVRGSKGRGEPEEFLPCRTPFALDNHWTLPVPAIDFTASGNGGIAPGLTLALRFAVERVDSPLDESVPEKVLVESVAHHYQSQKYVCRVKGAVL